ncbi:LysE family translocator [Paenarthrobacter sp. JL.01a]|uniref:LysE family translocator n=1 Tax=Paenarthrobacter sp. JL.01a TaxID=2979324 RepID=UPI0021C5E2C4|nr:LysE family translocator [Paenarthrobacter sp. JL.01a]UXM93557.1 LysE family translocator [Paenarthrobacter sp. JL.01a]
MVNEIWTSTLAGALVGLGVAMPLGAIAALLVREGIVNGFRVSSAAAAGVATVDLFYCAGATAAGTLLVRNIEEHRGIFLLASGLLITSIGVMQFLQGLKKPSRPDFEDSKSSSRAFLRFVGLTAVNPLTLVYFVALGGSVVGPGGSWAAPAAFTLAAGLTSFAWQLVLASLGSFFGKAVGPRTARTIGIAASLLVLTLGTLVTINGAAALGNSAG